MTLLHGENFERDVEDDGKETKEGRENDWSNDLHTIWRAIEITAPDLAGVIHLKKKTHNNVLKNTQKFNRNYVYFLHPYSIKNVNTHAFRIFRLQVTEINVELFVNRIAVRTHCVVGAVKQSEWNNGRLQNTTIYNLHEIVL